MTIAVRAATHADFPALGTLLGRAFADDPVWMWVYPQPDRAQRLSRMFRALLTSTAARGAAVLTDDDCRGAAIWQRSDARKLGAVGNVRMGAAMVASGARMGRGAAVMRATESNHPSEPHWYLAVLGTDPDHQGTGVGSALMHHVLDDPANAEMPAYLETETEGNVSYYSRHGFEVTGEVDIGTDGPHMWLMWRDPAP